jgi:uncharacterized protein YecA (UPF0149 family)
MRAIDLGPEAWEPLFHDKTNRVLLAPILMLGTEEDLDQVDANVDSESEYAAAVEMLELSVASIHTYWRLPIEKRAATRASGKTTRNATIPVLVAAGASLKGAVPFRP